MLLNDIGKSPNSVFRKINHHLELNYGFKLNEDVNHTDLRIIIEQIENEITELKFKGDDAKFSPEISKRLLILEGIQSLQEFIVLQSPKFNTVVDNLSDFIVDMFEISGYHGLPEFEKAVDRAMDEYRSSRYRFPDDIVEQKIRANAMAKINSVQESNSLLDVMQENENDMYGNVAKRSSALGGYNAEVPNTDAGRRAMKVLDNPALSLQPKEDDLVPMIRDKSGRMVPDPFAAQAAQRKKGIVMKETQENLIKNLRKLLETEVSQAEVMMAAKGFAQELQEMVEKIGRLQNEDLPPVTDQMRETYGTDSSSAFQTQIYGALQGVMDALYTAKGQVDDAVSNMAETGQVSASVDMEKDIDMGPDMGGEEDVSMDAELDLDNVEDELGAEDEFGGAEMEDPLGRSKKMESLQNKIYQMKTLVEKTRKLKESKKK